MNVQVLAAVIQSATHIIGSAIANRRPKLSEPRISIKTQEEPEEATIHMSITPESTGEQAKRMESSEAKATGVKSGCIPCSIGHVGVCSGLLNEATRFARKDGIQSPEVIDRVNMCLDELNAMERIDLRPEMTTKLPTWEKALATTVLEKSRDTRHSLESLRDVEGLEKAAAEVQTVRQEVGRQWFNEKLKNLSPEDKERIKTRVAERLEEITSSGVGGEVSEDEIHSG